MNVKIQEKGSRYSKTQRKNKKELLKLMIGLHATEMLLSHLTIVLFLTAIHLSNRRTEVYHFSPLSKVFKLENEQIVVAKAALKEKRKRCPSDIFLNRC